MKIFICVKQVSDTRGKVSLRKDGTLDRKTMAAIVNPDDLHALEAALSIKDVENCRVIALSMGPPMAGEMLAECLALGVDETYLICDRAFAGADTYATSHVLAAAICKIGLEEGDLVFCGRKAIDGDTAQVGPELSEKLGIALVTDAEKLEYLSGQSSLVAECRTDKGYREVQTGTPCLITCGKGLNRPRYMTAQEITRSTEKPHTVYSYEDLKNEPIMRGVQVGLAGSPTVVALTFSIGKQASECRFHDAQRGGIRELAAHITDRSAL